MSFSSIFISIKKIVTDMCDLISHNAKTCSADNFYSAFKDKLIEKRFP